MISGEVRFVAVRHPVSRAAVVAAVQAAADHQQRRGMIIAGSLLWQTARIINQRSGSLDLAGVTLDDLADATLPLALPQPALLRQFSQICRNGPQRIRYRTLRRHLHRIAWVFNTAFGQLLDLDAELVDDVLVAPGGG